MTSLTNRTKRLAISCLLTLGALASSAHAERFIDTFAAPLPEQVLPGTSAPAPLLWVGSISGSSQSQDSASQSSLPGVLGGRRETRINSTNGSSNPITLSSISGTRYALGYATGSGPSGSMTLEYGAQQDLNANLSGDGSVAFELEIVGDMDDGAAPRPVTLTLYARSGGGGLVESSISMDHDGVYQIPFSSFPGVNFLDVDYLAFKFDANQVSAVDYDLISGLRTTRCLQPGGSPVADIFLDTFGAPLPLNTLPGAGPWPGLWAGTLGGVQQDKDIANQSGLVGTIGGQRYTEVLASSLSNVVTAVMSQLNGTPELLYSTGFPTSGKLTLRYGAQANLNADLSQAVAFELHLDGDLDDGGAPRPVPLTVTVTTGAGTKSVVTRSATVTLLNDGMVYLPFAAFSPGLNFHDVDRVTFVFDASNVQAVDYALIGGLRASACIP